MRYEILLIKRLLLYCFIYEKIEMEEIDNRVFPYHCWFIGNPYNQEPDMIYHVNDNLLPVSDNKATGARSNIKTKDVNIKAGIKGRKLKHKLYLFCIRAPPPLWYVAPVCNVLFTLLTKSWLVAGGCWCPLSGPAAARADPQSLCVHVWCSRGQFVIPSTII